MNTDKPILELIKEHLERDLTALPVFNPVAVKLQQLLVNRNLNINDVLKLIKSDQSLSSQVLRMSNSSYYAGLSKISTIKEAIVRLGIQEVANLAMMASQYECYHSSNATIDNYMQSLWKHAFSCATGAKWLARKAGYPDLAQEAF